MGIIDAAELMDDYHAQAQHEAHREGNAAGKDDLSAVSAAQAEAEALMPGEPQRVSLSDGSAVEISEPKALAWMGALANLQGAIGPVAMLLSLLREDPKLLETDEGKMVVFSRLMARLGDDPDAIVGSMAKVLRAVDSLAGQPAGWAQGLDVPDLMAVGAALVRCIRPERYRYFFGQLKAALRAQAAAFAPPR
jgi:hypothetical protein